MVPQGEVGDRLIDALSDAIAKLHVAGQFDKEPAPFYGGLVSVAAADGLLNAQDELEAMGGTVINRMQRLKENTSLLSPALIDVTGLDVPDEEHFGPLLKIHATRIGMRRWPLPTTPATACLLVDRWRAGGLGRLLVAYSRRHCELEPPDHRSLWRCALRRRRRQRQPPPQRLLRRRLLRVPGRLHGAESLEMPETLPPGVNL